MIRGVHDRHGMGAGRVFVTERAVFFMRGITGFPGIMIMPLMRHRMGLGDGITGIRAEHG